MNDLLSCLPFHSLSDREFKSVNGIWFNVIDQLIDVDLYNIIPNPDKFDENDSDLMLTTLKSDYYSIDKINDYLDKAGPKAFSLFHCNVRSLTKNLTLLDDLLYSLNKRPDGFCNN